MSNEQCCSITQANYSLLIINCSLILQTFLNPEPATWPALQQRAEHAAAPEVAARVRDIFAEVQQHGDAALRRYAAELDGVPNLADLRVTAVS